MSINRYSKYRQVNNQKSYDGHSEFEKTKNAYTIRDANDNIVLSFGKMANGTYGLLAVSGNVNITGPDGQIYMENGRITAVGITTSGLSAITAILGDVIIGGSGNKQGSISIYDENDVLRVQLDKNGIRGNATSLLSDDSGFIFDIDGKARIGTADGSELEQGLLNDGEDVWIKSKDDKLFFKNPISLMDYQIGSGKNLLKDHNAELLNNPLLNTVSATGVYPVMVRSCLTQETVKRLDNTTGSITKMAQSFTWDSNALYSFWTYTFCAGIWLKLIRSFVLMLGGNFTVRLETDNAGSPSGTLADPSATVSIDERYVGGTTFYDPESLFYFPFPAGFALTHEARYWIVISAAGLDATNYFEFKHDNASDSYADGASKYYDGAWKSYTGDFYFGVMARSNMTTTNDLIEITYNNINDLFNQEWSVTNNVRALQPDYDCINPTIKPNWYMEGFPCINRKEFGFPVLTGSQSITVDNLNYAYQIACRNVIAEKEYTFSADIGTHGQNGNTAAASISAILKIEAFTTNANGSLTSLGSTTETTLITASFDTDIDDSKIIRAKCNYTLPATTYYVKVSVYSASTEKIRTDGWKLEEASFPTVYHEESSLWKHATGKSNQHIQGSINNFSLLNGMVKSRKGGSATVWGTAGTTNYNESTTNCFIQVGTHAFTGSTAITFPTAFKGTPIVIGTVVTAAAVNAFFRCSAVSSTGFTAQVIDHAGNNASETANWIAIGI
jgi:hypothetical protein